jgi:nitrate reductase cytochrome c-type subunit
MGEANGYCKCDPLVTNTFREYFDEFDFDGKVMAHASEVICLKCHLPQKGTYKSKIGKTTK